jgi:hypothetical protein
MEIPSPMVRGGHAMAGDARLGRAVIPIPPPPDPKNEPHREPRSIAVDELEFEQNQSFG